MPIITNSVTYYQKEHDFRCAPTTYNFPKLKDLFGKVEDLLKLQEQDVTQSKQNPLSFVCGILLKKPIKVFEENKSTDPKSVYCFFYLDKYLDIRNDKDQKDLLERVKKTQRFIFFLQSEQSKITTVLVHGKQKIFKDSTIAAIGTASFKEDGSHKEGPQVHRYTNRFNKEKIYPTEFKIDEFSDIKIIPIKEDLYQDLFNRMCKASGLFPDTSESQPQNSSSSSSNNGNESVSNNNNNNNGTPPSFETTPPSAQTSESSHSPLSKKKIKKVRFAKEAESTLKKKFNNEPSTVVRKRSGSEPTKPSESKEEKTDSQKLSKQSKETASSPTVKPRKLSKEKKTDTSNGSPKPSMLANFKVFLKGPLEKDTVNPKSQVSPAKSPQEPSKESLFDRLKSNALVFAKGPVQ